MSDSLHIAFVTPEVVAGSDMFLMPSRSEPCGLTQMCALRYGTGLVWAVAQAVSAFRRPKAWTALMRRAMARDFSGERSAREYVDLYRRVMAKA